MNGEQEVNNFQAERGRGRGRVGRGRGNRGRGRGQAPAGDPAPHPAPAPAPAPAASAPAQTVKEKVKKSNNKGEVNFKPQYQSSSASQEKNDPLVNSMLLIPGVSGFVERVSHRRFQLDYTMYQELLRVSYDAQVTFDRSLKKYLPFSCYQYYSHVMLWRRLLNVLSARGHHTLEHDRIEALFVQETPIPEDIHLYLLEIGDIVDANARQFELSLQATPTDDMFFGAQGSFGPVDDDTHILYETVPAPLISLLKLQADLQYTQASQDPAELRKFYWYW